MPNKVTYSDEKTMAKVYRAIVGDGQLGLDQALDVVDRLQTAGILFMEPVPAANKNDTPVSE